VQDSSNYIAIDIGNSHVRIYVGNFNGEKLSLEEMYQFRNKQVFVRNHLFCDLLSIYQGIKDGFFVSSKKIKNHISGIGIDSWGVDYVLLDANDNQLSNTYHHTDSRTEGMFEQIFQKISTF